MKLNFSVILSILFCANFVYGFPNYLQDEAFSIRSKHSEAMKSYMNRSIDPCDDFYEYACGQWNDNNPKDIYLSVLVLLERSTNQLINTILKSTEPKNDLEKQVKTFFASCSNDNKVNEKSMASVKSFIDYLGGWPDLDDKWSENHFNLISAVVKRQNTGLNSIMPIAVAADVVNPKSHNIYIMSPPTGLQDPADYSKSEGSHLRNLRAYRIFILDLLQIFSVPTHKADEMADDIINFETLLTEFKTPAEATAEERYKPTNLQSLIDNYPDFDWQKYFDGVFGYKVPLNQNAIIYGIPSFDKFINLIANTEKKVLANFMAWLTIYDLSTEYLLDDNFLEATIKFNQVIIGESIPSRRSVCAHKTKTQLNYIVASMFIKSINFDNDAHKDVEQIVENIKDVFADRLEKADWIDYTTKSEANIKLSHLKLAIGQPDILDDKQKLMEYYKELDVLDEDKFLENYIQLAKFSAKKRMGKLNELVDKNEWPDSALSMNAFYQYQNRIIVPGGILQPPVYNKYFPQALKYGKLGFFLGHELTHGFDVKGKEYNYEGELKSWWTPESERNFNEKATCITDQYSQYTLHGQHISGTLTLAENIADNGAIRLAYESYKKWLSTASHNEILEDQLPDTEITNEKLFFVGMAQSQCTSPITAEATANHLVDEHSPSKHRVIGMLQNLPEFSDIFECPVGSPMNPEEKCNLW